ncbi:hypothetical protein MASSI9I_70464 [Massilia sp. 9I]|nr:hypothetical protein MASSI9I_70464 [Massilia sp. 9I]
MQREFDPVEGPVQNRISLLIRSLNPVQWATIPTIRVPSFFLRSRLRKKTHSVHRKNNKCSPFSSVSYPVRC